MQSAWSHVWCINSRCNLVEIRRMSLAYVLCPSAMKEASLPPLSSHSFRTPSQFRHRAMGTIWYFAFGFIYTMYILPMLRYATYAQHCRTINRARIPSKYFISVQCVTRSDLSQLLIALRSQTLIKPYAFVETIEFCNCLLFWNFRTCFERDSIIPLTLSLSLSLIII